MPASNGPTAQPQHSPWLLPRPTTSLHHRTGGQTAPPAKGKAKPTAVPMAPSPSDTPVLSAAEKELQGATPVGRMWLTDSPLPLRSTPFPSEPAVKPPTPMHEATGTRRGVQPRTFTGWCWSPPPPAAGLLRAMLLVRGCSPMASPHAGVPEPQPASISVPFSQISPGSSGGASRSKYHMQKKVRLPRLVFKCCGVIILNKMDRYRALHPAAKSELHNI